MSQKPLAKRSVIDRKALIQKIDAAAMDVAPDDFRPALLGALKDALAAGQKTIQQHFEAGDIDGRKCASFQSHLTDQIVRVAYDMTLKYVYPLGNPTKSEKIAVIALGGYGRAEMAPFSDVDIMFLHPYKNTPWVENVAEFMLYLLWDLSFKVGHAVRTEDECIRMAKDDITIRTAVLEARYVWGDQDLFTSLMARFKKQVVKGSGAQFVDEKLNERSLRHHKVGGSRYMVEPNLKDGKGGHRDLNTLVWIARYLYEVTTAKEMAEKGLLSNSELGRYRKSEALLWEVRCHLHYLAKRAEERLTFDLQTDLAHRMGYGDEGGLSAVERFMKDYFRVAREVGTLTRVFCAELEAQQKKKKLLSFVDFSRKRKVEGFPIVAGRISFTGEDDVKKTPINMLRIFKVADDNGLDIHPNAMRLMRRFVGKIKAPMRKDPEANALFLQILTSRNDPLAALQRMNEVGVFGRFIPDFGGIVAQSQYDMYHHYTVDEHTIRALGLLARIEKGELSEDHPIANLVIHKLASRRVLYVAVLLHDIAKGRGGDHSILGAEVAEKLCPRLGLSAAETEFVAWLVKHHLLMSYTAMRRDVSDPKTVSDFVGVVQSPERLRALLVLTVVDTRAVGPNVWNGWKRQLITELYDAAAAVLAGSQVEVGRKERMGTKQILLREQLTSWTEASWKAHSGRFDDAYWISETTETQVRNAALLQKAAKKKNAVHMATHVDKTRSMTEVSIYTKNVTGLFTKLAGALASLGANIVDAKIFTTYDGMALDNFTVQDDEGHAFSDAKKLTALHQRIVDVLEGNVNLKDLLDRKSLVPDRTEVFTVEPFVVFDNRASDRFTVMETNARDREGLLHDLTEVLFKNRVSVESAHVSTFGVRAVDVFYLSELDGRKITNDRRLKSLEAKILKTAGGSS